MTERGCSQPGACRLIEVDPKAVRRERTPDAPEVRERLKAPAGRRRRFGDRRPGVLPARKNIVMNEKKLFRLYREEGLPGRAPAGRSACADWGIFQAHYCGGFFGR